MEAGDDGLKLEMSVEQEDVEMVRSKTVPFRLYCYLCLVLLDVKLLDLYDTGCC